MPVYFPNFGNIHSSLISKAQAKMHIKLWKKRKILARFFTEKIHRTGLAVKKMRRREMKKTQVNWMNQECCYEICFQMIYRACKLPMREQEDAECNSAYFLFILSRWLGHRSLKFIYTQQQQKTHADTNI